MSFKANQNPSKVGNVKNIKGLEYVFKMPIGVLIAVLTRPAAVSLHLVTQKRVF